MSNVRCGGVKGMLKSTSSSRGGVFVESSAEVLGGAGGRDRTPPSRLAVASDSSTRPSGSVCVLWSSK